jgi:endonuclease YncB( thermonuclease family)
MPFVPFCYAAWIKRLDWKSGQLVADASVIHDGDSGYALLDRGEREYGNSSFRLYGVNTPELNATDPEVRAKAVAARDWLREKILGKQVWVRSMGLEKYGRILLIIWDTKEAADTGDTVKSINAQLIQNGHAMAYMGEII